MRTDYDPLPSSRPAPSLDAEARLERSRAALRRQLLEEKSGTKPNNTFGDISGAVKLGSPIAREWVRQHPYTSLSAAAMTGLILMRWKPWRGLGSSLVAGLLTRQALSLALSSRTRALNWVLDSAFKKKTGAGTVPVAKPGIYQKK